MGINAKLSDITEAASIDGSELVYVVQNGNSRRSTIARNIVEGASGLSNSQKASLRSSISAAPYAATRTALKALDTSKDTTAILTESGRKGVFQFDETDVSSIMSPYSATTTAVNSGTDTCTAAAHGFLTGMAAYPTATANGLNAETLYYAIRVDDDNFKLATSYANAVAGTAVDLTGTTNLTFKRYADPLEAIYVVPDGAAFDGSEGAWVRQFGGPLNLKWFGAVADFDWTALTGTDAAPYKQHAHDLAYVLGVQTVYQPGGHWLIDSNMRLSRSVTFLGDGFDEGDEQAAQTGPGQGTWECIKSTSFTPYTIDTTHGHPRFEKMAWWQSHSTTFEMGWAPTAYPWLFDQSTGPRTSPSYFDEVMFFNINKVINLKSGRTTMREVKGQIFTQFSDMDNVLDIIKFDGFHIWPFWSINRTGEEYVVAHMIANLDVFQMGRVDNPMFSNIFVFAARSVYRAISSANGQTNKFKIVNSDADFVKHGLWIEADGVTGQVVNFTAQGSDFPSSGGGHITDSCGIRITGDNATLEIANIDITETDSSSIRIEGSNSRVLAGPLRLRNFNQSAGGHQAVYVAATNRFLYGGAISYTGANGDLFGGSGVIGIQANGPGSAAAPALIVGVDDYGFYWSGNALRAAADGAEILTLNADGSASIGGTGIPYRARITTLGDWELGGDWAGGRIKMGNYYLWVDDTGVLRIKSGLPGSDTDGTVVGAQS